jgi:hypothetical protein
VPNAPIQPNVVEVVQNLDSAAIAERLDAITREAAALRVLYKAAKASERARAALPPHHGKAVAS